ncbi:MAG: hypothetical protein GF421_06930 [Candidatus Aminicenantes bacterium]|nr:hypothetical protein [Candidatus Aminicenantes bacterium]
MRNNKPRAFCVGMVFLLGIGLIFSSTCSVGTENHGTEHAFPQFSLINEIKSDPESPFYINFEDYPSQLESYPIGVFDSGTGGLSVLNAILAMDLFNNRTHEKGSDGIPDFNSESFVYLGDKANMPYGRYPSEQNTDFLRELIIKDVWFLLGSRFFQSSEEPIAEGEKKPVKAVVIACNTATAYGIDLIEYVITEWGLNLKTIGIIDAGMKMALESVGSEEKALLGVFATQGTCDSQGYINAFEKALPETKKQKVDIIQQACLGLAGAVDGDPAYISKDAVEIRGIGSYQGPGIRHQTHPVDLSLWKEYNFDQGNALLVKKDKQGEPNQVELNSVRNYINYYVTSFVIRAIKSPEIRSLQTIILGCTHYALFKKEFREHFLYLRTLDDRYKRFIPKDLIIIDPAEAQAMALYHHLSQNDLFSPNQPQKYQFFFSVPNPLLEANVITPRREFPNDYKYSRCINRSLVYVKRIPLKKELLSQDIIVKLKSSYPALYEMMFSPNE